MNTKLVNPKVLNALSKVELMKKHNEYLKLWEIYGGVNSLEVAGEYLKEYNKRDAGIRGLNSCPL